MSNCTGGASRWVSIFDNFMNCIGGLHQLSGNRFATGRLESSSVMTIFVLENLYVAFESDTDMTS